jgi:hypothetical protein
MRLFESKKIKRLLESSKPLLPQLLHALEEEGFRDVSVKQTIYQMRNENLTVTAKLGNDFSFEMTLNSDHYTIRSCRMRNEESDKFLDLQKQFNLRTIADIDAPVMIYIAIQYLQEGYDKYIAIE